MRARGPRAKEQADGGGKDPLVHGAARRQRAQHLVVGFHGHVERACRVELWSSPAPSTSRQATRLDLAVFFSWRLERMNATGRKGPVRQTRPTFIFSWKSLSQPAGNLCIIPSPNRDSLASRKAFSRPDSRPPGRRLSRHSMWYVRLYGVLCWAGKETDAQGPSGPATLVLAVRRQNVDKRRVVCADKRDNG